MSRDRKDTRFLKVCDLVLNPLNQILKLLLLLPKSLKLVLNPQDRNLELLEHIKYLVHPIKTWRV